ncbi:zinc finger protein 862-like [Ruditapes philippinarum]|uniref:zinc finger protein 862-like n=1 Tax=Ruditapes philippinarum TaxID=129788 RepID=UPI00295B4F1A|nr:zinc finger protein 862-like [Ruditapes philippinarum]
MQKLIDKKLSKDDETAVQYLKCAYYIAKRELPKSEMKHMINFVGTIGCKVNEMQHSNSDYTSGTSVSEFHSALAGVILEDKMELVKKSGVFSIVLDESTDIGNQKRVLMYAQYVTLDGLEYCLLSNKQLTAGSGNADNIVEMVIDELKSKGLDISKMVGIGTDGASVMTGRKNGVVVKLKEHSPSLVGAHCAAHRTALATSQAAKYVHEMDEYSRTVSSVFRYFSNSSLRSNRLRAIQSVLNLPELKFSEVHSVRWLSMENAVTAIYRSYPALCMCLEREAIYDSAAKGLFNDVIQFKFIAMTHVMMDILPFMGRLSKNFQSKVLDFSMIDPLVQSTCDSLEDLVECEGAFVDKLSCFVKESDDKVLYVRPDSESQLETVKETVKSNIEFEGFESNEDSDNDTEFVETSAFHPELKYYTQQKNVVNKVMNKYVGKLVENLQDRFQDRKVISNMNVLVPANIITAESVAKYGVNEFKDLVDHYAPHVTGSIDLCLSEYQQFKRLVCGSYRNMSLIEIVCEMQKKYSEMIPNVLTILKCCVVLPMSSVQCERGFSTQNRIKSKLRTSIKSETLDNLMRISEDGPDIMKFDFDRALKKWKSEKRRKLYAY